MKTFITSFYRIFVIALLLVGCNSDDSVDPASVNDDPILSDEQIEVLDNAPSADVELDDIILPNGMSTQAFFDKYDPTFLESLKGGRKATINVPPFLQKSLLVGKMLAKAQRLCDRTKFTENGQNGLAYVFGSKDLTLKPPSKDKGVHSALSCTKELIGLDCSGFMLQLATAAKLNGIPINAAGQGDTAVWSKAFKNSDEFKSLTVKRFDNLPLSKIVSGDLLYFLDSTTHAVNHTGIAISDPKKKDLIFYNSNGTSWDNPKPNKGCVFNTGLNRGPNSKIILASAIKIFAKGGYYIIRPVAKQESVYTIHLKCQGSTTDNIVVDVLFAPGSIKGETAGVGFGKHIKGDSILFGMHGVLDTISMSFTGELTTVVFDKDWTIKSNALLAELQGMGNPRTTQEDIRADVISAILDEHFRDYMRYDLFTVPLSEVETPYVNLKYDPDFATNNVPELKPCPGAIKMVFKK